MADYLLIESRDPFSSHEAKRLYSLAQELVNEGNTVTLFLVENGTLAARTDVLEATMQAGVEVLADRFALLERGIQDPKVPSADLDRLVDLLAEGRKAMWH